MADHERILFRTLESLLGDLADNRELSGAATCDSARSEAYESGNEDVLRLFEEDERPSA